MTLVVAGYRQNEFRWNEDKSKECVPDRRSGIFLVADSLISTETRFGRQKLVSGFKKIVEVPVNVWQPHFVGELFQGYVKCFQTHKCLVAFAGSTLTAQHVINSITNHLSELRIDFEKGAPFRCVIRKSCEPNNLECNGIGTHYDDGIFIPDRDYRNLLSAEYISDVVEHSINQALSSQRKHVLGPEALRAMCTDIVLALTCPITREDCLYTYKFAHEEFAEGGVKAFCIKSFVSANEITVIGMEKTYGDALRTIVENSIENGDSLEENLIAAAIKYIREDQTGEIGMPTIHKTIQGYHISKKVYRDQLDT